MFDLAEGMRVPRPEGFVPNGKAVGGALRETYVKVHTAVNRLLGDMVQQRLAFILPKPMAVAYIDNLHLASAYWTPKKSKPSGRPIGDMTYVTGTPPPQHAGGHSRSSRDLRPHQTSYHRGLSRDGPEILGEDEKE